MFSDYKNFLYANILAIAGYPVILYIKFLIDYFPKPGSGDTIVWGTILYVFPYYLAVFCLVIITFIIELVLNLKNKNKQNLNFTDKLWFKIYFYTGIILFSTPLIFLLYVFLH